jgi:hypothetical protein
MKFDLSKETIALLNTVLSVDPALQNINWNNGLDLKALKLILNQIIKVQPENKIANQLHSALAKDFYDSFYNLSKTSYIKKEKKSSSKWGFIATLGLMGFISLFDIFSTTAATLKILIGVFGFALNPVNLAYTFIATSLLSAFFFIGLMAKQANIAKKLGFKKVPYAALEEIEHIKNVRRFLKKNPLDDLEEQKALLQFLASRLIYLDDRKDELKKALNSKKVKAAEYFVLIFGTIASFGLGFLTGYAATNFLIQTIPFLAALPVTTIIWPLAVMGIAFGVLNAVLYISSFPTALKTISSWFGLDKDELKDFSHKLEKENMKDVENMKFYPSVKPQNAYFEKVHKRLSIDSTNLEDENDVKDGLVVTLS